MSDLTPDSPASDPQGWWTTSTLPESAVPGFGPGGPPPPPRRRRWRTVLVTVVIVLAVLAFIADRINLNYYAISPGQAQPVEPLVKVPPSKGHDTGTILLTDVYVGQVTLLNYIPNWLSSNTQIVSSDELVAPGTSPGELTDQGYLEMEQSIDAAKTAAFTRLGYTVTQRPAGVQIGAIRLGTPAASTLGVADIITAVNSTPTLDECSFVTALHPLQPGESVTLTVQPASVTPQGTLSYGSAVHEQLKMAPAPKGLAASGCPGVSGPPKAVLGVEVVPRIAYHYPFPVSVNTAGIGGPSAGLAMTLGIMDQLAPGRLSHGVIAATGTINSAEQVGPVGGVPQKTVAVENAGATLFMVPPLEFNDAVSKATPSLHVCKVSNLSQALGVLKHYGGQVSASMHPAPVARGECT